MKTLVFEKSLTRDWSLLAVQIQHTALTQEFQQQFGWGYAEAPFEGTEGHVSLYRSPQEHVEGMRRFLLTSLEKDPGFIHRAATSLKKDFIRFQQFIEKYSVAVLNRLNVDQQVNILQQLFDGYRTLLPRFVLLLWFPQHLEGHAAKERYAADIAVAIEARKETEKLGPLGDELALYLGTVAARRAGLPENLGKFLTRDELEAALREQATPPTRELERRARHFVFGNRGLRDTPLAEYLAAQGFRLAQQVVAAGASEVRGMAAYGGVVRGTVRILFRKADIPLLQEGEVLVTGMTTPEFLPAMKRAAAFVTDEGGITCHAAIVARELKKPCIIGTKISTQALQDGDLVEVDAEQGIIRVVQRAGGAVG